MAHLALCDTDPPEPELTAGPCGGPSVLVTTRLDGEIAFLSLQGEVDFGAVGPLELAVASVVDAGIRCLVLDLGGVAFLDCSGVRLLLRFRELTESRGGWLRLERVPARALRVLCLTGTHTVLGLGPESVPMGEQTRA
jgi:anti-anti-sigma factor